jgi:hypothetical protein
MTKNPFPTLGFLELGEQTVLLARARFGQGRRVVEEVREVWLGDPENALAAIREFVPGRGMPGPVVLLRPRMRTIVRASAEQAMRVTDAAAVRRMLSHRFDSAGAQAGWAWCASDTGGPPAIGQTWLLDVMLAPGCGETFGQLTRWDVAPLRSQSARLALAGALAGTVGSLPAATPLLLCDIGETRTDLLVITAGGVQNVVTVAAGLGTVVDALQAALKLRLRGTAVRLLHGPAYDFSGLGAKILQPLADRLKPALTSLRQRPAALVCQGLIDGHTWPALNLAAALGLPPFTLDVTAWAGARSLAFSGEIQTDRIPPAWLGLLGAVATFDIAQPAAPLPWQPSFNDVPPSVTSLPN